MNIFNNTENNKLNEDSDDEMDTEDIKKIFDDINKKYSNNNNSNDINTIEQFKNEVNKYLSKNTVKVALLTPTYNNTCYINYVTCLINTIEVLKHFNIGLKIEFCRNDSLVSRARNNLVARALYDETVTHVLFIDSDITWDPIDIIKLIISDKHIIGGIYPLKRYNWEKLKEKDIVNKWIDKKNNSQLKNIISDTDTIQHNLLSYNVNFIGNQLNVVSNVASVRHIANGFMLIKRVVFEKMFLAFPSTKYTDDVNFLKPEENKYAYALFDCGVEDDHYLSEDWMFCDRWIKMGGEVYIDVTVNLTHSGLEDYKGSFIDNLMNINN